jgi:glycosyltransferase involved in cell wall biosynthesis
MPYPRVTVLIPAYNAARTIERALASVWRQNCPAMEVIVIDDCSTDDTGLHVEKMTGGNLSLIRLDRNRGVSGALNVGIRQARNDYIAFLDADDEWLADKLTKQLPIIEAHPDMTLIACGGESVDPAGRTLIPSDWSCLPILRASSGELYWSKRIFPDPRLSLDVPGCSRLAGLTRSSR